MGPPAPTDVFSPRHAGVFTHVLAAGSGPNGVVHDPVHNRIRVHPGTKPLMPILLGILRAEHRRSGVIPALQQLLGTAL